MRLSDRIRTARLRMDWNQSELAAVLKVDRSAVGHWERGEGSKPSTARLIALAGLTGVCVEWLAMGTGPMVPAGDASAAGQFSADELRLVQEYRRRDGGARALIVNLADPLLPPPRKQDARWIDRGLKRGWADGLQAKGAGFQLYGGLSMPAALRASFSLFARAPGARSRWNDELREFWLWLTPARRSRYRA